MKRAARLLVPVLLTLLASPAAFGVQTDTIPFEFNDDGHLIFEVSLNGAADTDAVIDTGATFPIIDSRSAASAGVLAPDGIETIQIAGLAGIRQFPVIQLQRLTLGGLEFEGVAAAYNHEYELPGARNVLPALILQHRVLDFDFAEGRLQAYDRSPIRLKNVSTSRLQMEGINRLLFVDVSLNGIPGRALIDTGASVSFVNSAFASRALGRRSSIREIELVGATGPIGTARIFSTRNFRIGSFAINRLETYIADPEFLKANGLEGEPVMVIGLDLLRNFRVQIDRQDQLILLSRPLTGLQIRPL